MGGAGSMCVTGVTPLVVTLSTISTVVMEMLPRLALVTGCVVMVNVAGCCRTAGLCSILT